MPASQVILVRIYIDHFLFPLVIQHLRSAESDGFLSSLLFLEFFVAPVRRKFPKFNTFVLAARDDDVKVLKPVEFCDVTVVSFLLI